MVDLSAVYSLMKPYRAGWDFLGAEKQLEEDRQWLRVWPAVGGRKRGHFFIHGPGTLAWTGSSNLGKKLEFSGVVKVHQRGDKEMTVIFPLEMAESVFAIVRPIRRRRGNPENLRPFRFQAA